MASKKKADSGTEELTQEELESKFDSGNVEETKKSKPKIKTKSTFSLADYKKEKQANSVAFKPQTWIKMGPAFQSITALPGIPEGSINIVYGRSDTGKSTMLLELAKYAQEQGVLPVFIITEKKWSWDRCDEIGIDRENCLYRDDIDFIEQGCDFIEEVLKDQAEGRCPTDIVFLWDSIGATPSKKEFDAAEEGEGGGGMMLTSRVLRERFARRICHKITSTRKETHPYNATLFIVNHAYQSPPSFPGGQTTLKPYGGDGIYYTATLVFRMGGIMSNSSKVKATKDGTQVAFAIKSALVVEKNHITNVAPDGKILCTPHGFIEDSKEAIEFYKKQYKDDWQLEFDKDWDKVSKD
jgi:RecA/RadA recombinase